MGWLECDMENSTGHKHKQTQNAAEHSMHAENALYISLSEQQCNNIKKEGCQLHFCHFSSKWKYQYDFCHR